MVNKSRSAVDWPRTGLALAAVAVMIGLAIAANVLPIDVGVLHPVQSGPNRIGLCQVLTPSSCPQNSPDR